MESAHGLVFSAPLLCFFTKLFALIQWRIQGRGPGGPSLLFLDKTKARRAEKNILETGSPLSQGPDDRPLPSSLVSRSGSGTVIRNVMDHDGGSALPGKKKEQDRFYSNET